MAQQQIHNENNLDIKSAYEEGCNTIRHYSIAVRNVRTIAVAQGFVVLSGVAILTKEGHSELSMIGAIFGVFLTAILGTLHSNYLQNTMVSIDHIIEIEKNICHQR